MTADSDKYVLGDWFRCPRCSESSEGWFDAKQFLAFGNVSMKLDCKACGFSHEARDWRNVNLKSSIRRKRWFLEAFLTHPRCGATMHDAAKCARCSSRGHVTVEVEREEHGPEYDKEYVSVVRLNCEECGATHENALSH